MIILKLHERLILNKYFLSLFGVDRFADFRPEEEREANLRDVLKNVEENFENTDRSNYMNSILNSTLLNIDKQLKVKLETYDKNIMEYINFINQKREKPIFLTYFQYLSILFTEIYLDRYYNDRNKFITDLNDFVDKVNMEIKESKNKYSHFHERDLNKLAFYMATGSGKTLIMHINYLQFKKYSNQEINNILLITPNSGLSRQHLEEFEKSSIKAQLFIDNLMGFKEEDVIYIIEITKLVQKKEGEGDSVEVSSLENNNLIFVDEGHRGSTGDIWKSNREELANKGFIFEYSATFGQAVEGQIHKSNSWRNEADYYSKRVENIGLDEKIKKRLFRINKKETYINMSKYELEKELMKYELADAQRQAIINCYDNNFEEYSKSIIFDYSYKYFHADGYGKDYNILNLKSDSIDGYSEVYLLANLLTFYEQKKYFIDNREFLEEYNLENPLLMFVGHTVSASNSLTTDDKKSISDLGFILRFINNFIKYERDMINLIDNILNEKSGLIDSNGVDIFSESFRYIKAQEYTPENLYFDIIKEIFNCKGKKEGTLEIYDIKQADGELGLKIRGEDNYFGIINIGDSNSLIKHLENQDFVKLMEDEFSGSLFQEINRKDSSINILIGSKKFTEGWNSYRVSSIGLLNIGRSAGSQIIQIFGRGVRLKGYKRLLKRSKELPIKIKKDHPTNIEILETLNVFGIKADYMEEFEEYLRSEDIATDRIKEIELPIELNKEFLNSGLVTLNLKEGINFKEDVNIQLNSNDVSFVEVNLLPKIEKISSNLSNSVEKEKPEQVKIDNIYINLCNWDRIYLEIVKYKRAKGYWNLLISKDVLKEIISKEKYILYCNEIDVIPKKFDDIQKLENIIINILKKYVNAFYRNQRLKYEDEHLVYEYLKKDDGNFKFKNYVLQVKENEKELIAYIEEIIENGEIYKKEFDKKSGVNNVYFDRHIYQPLLTQSEKVKSVPVGLNKYEKDFIKNLRDYISTDNFKEICQDKEVFVLRNLSIGNGIGFFEADNFYPDFILWIKEKGKQYITFVDPKGIVMLGTKDHPKIKLAKTIKYRQDRLKSYKDQSIILNSFIISNTNINKVKEVFKDPKLNTEEDFLDINIIFNNDPDGIDKMFRKILEDK